MGLGDCVVYHKGKGDENMGDPACLGYTEIWTDPENMTLVRYISSEHDWRVIVQMLYMY